MNKTQLMFALGVALITAAGAYWQGKITDRWSNEVSQKLVSYSERLQGVPTQVGQWVSQDTEVNEEQFEASHCHDKISRVYVNQATGEEVNVFLVSGKAIHVTQHSPDWCYVAAGYKMDVDPSVYGFDAEGIPKPEFLNAVFHKVTSTSTTRLRILWSFSEDGKWSASKLATYSFAGKPALYKVYLISDANDTIPQLRDDPAVNFAKEFLPAISPILFPGGAGDSSETAQAADASSDSDAA